MNPYKFIAIFVFIFFTSVCLADTQQELEQLVKENLTSSQTENLEATLNTLHTQAPIYASASKSLAQIFAAYDLNYTLQSFELIGQDEDYAYGRLKLTTEKVAGPAFRDNDIDALAVFAKEDGVWKFWQQINLAVAFK